MASVYVCAWLRVTVKRGLKLQIKHILNGKCVRMCLAPYHCQAWPQTPNKAHPQWQVCTCVPGSVSLSSVASKYSSVTWRTACNVLCIINSMVAMVTARSRNFFFPYLPTLVLEQFRPSNLLVWPYWPKCMLEPTPHPHPDPTLGLNLQEDHYLDKVTGPKVSLLVPL